MHAWNCSMVGSSTAQSNKKSSLVLVLVQKPTQPASSLDMRRKHTGYQRLIPIQWKIIAIFRLHICVLGE